MLLTFGATLMNEEKVNLSNILADVKKHVIDAKALKERLCLFRVRLVGVDKPPPMSGGAGGGGGCGSSHTYGGAAGAATVHEPGMLDTLNSDVAVIGYMLQDIGGLMDSIESTLGKR